MSSSFMFILQTLLILCLANRILVYHVFGIVSPDSLVSVDSDSSQAVSSISFALNEKAQEETMFQNRDKRDHFFLSFLNLIWYYLFHWILMVIHTMKLFIDSSLTDKTLLQKFLCNLLCVFRTFVTENDHRSIFQELHEFLVSNHTDRTGRRQTRIDRWIRNVHWNFSSRCR